jgi:hypothetical protein
MYNSESTLKMIRKYKKFRQAGEINMVNKDRFQYLDYDSAEKIVRAFKFRSQREWNAYRKKHKEDLSKIPLAPDYFYKRWENKKWKGWQNFLGHNNHRHCVSFKEAKLIVKKLGIKNKRQLIEYRKRSGDYRIPTCPATIYQDEGWKGCADYFSLI